MSSQKPLDGAESPKWKRPRKLRGLGDAVAVVANPIALGIDAMLGTQISNCGGCRKRQDALNRAMPLNSKTTPQMSLDKTLILPSVKIDRLQP